MYRKMPVLLFLVLILMAGCSGCQSGREEELTELTDARSEEVPEEVSEGTKEEDGQESAQDAAEPAEQDTAEMYVHVCGQVNHPGVYKLPAGSRMYEAIDAAGGLLLDAADELLNQAAQVEDGQQIYVPSRDEAMQGIVGRNMSNSGAEGQDMLGQSVTGSQVTAGAVPSADDGKINLNTASKEQLMTLSGIGEAKAGSIIAYREAHGGFQRIEDLMKVEGIKEGVFNKVKDQIKVS